MNDVCFSYLQVDQGLIFEGFLGVHGRRSQNSQELLYQLLNQIKLSARLFVRMEYMRMEMYFLDILVSINPYESSQ